MFASSKFPRATESQGPRYEIERKLGEGGAGAVFLVRDRETGEHLALKKLFRVDAKSVLRLKREFRSMQAVSHPHIVKLYDMGQADDSWFLTMEYLDGADLKSYVSSLREAQPSTFDGQALCVPRLLSAFQQLARGVHALHEAGLLHRDLKPSNVLMVDHRAVVLDFGLVRELSGSGNQVTEDGSMAGTPAYMAPEQILAKELTAATDWYAFGAMLYEAVTGELPFVGSALDILRQKLDAEPTSLQRLAPNAPRWMIELSDALLQRDPARRPGGAEVLACFEAAQPDTVPHTNTENIVQNVGDTRVAPNEFQGRAREFEQLWSALNQVEDGGAVVVHVRGASGAGKSALLEHFLEQLGSNASASSEADAVVFRSRCYELEDMPFKALDGLMDALTNHLSRLDEVFVAHLLPPDIHALVQVFPALQRLSAVRKLCAQRAPALDASQRLRRAEVALRALFDKLAGHTPVVLWIDDLQWGDLDSARILKSWITQPSAAPLLFIFSYRSDEVATSTVLRALLDEAATGSRAREHTIDLVPLEAQHIQALCERRLPVDMPGREALIERVVRDAQGNPFLASQLIALARAKSVRSDPDLMSVSLDLMVSQVSALLSADAQRLLSMLAIAGRPVAPKLLMQAAGVKHGGRRLVHDLRALNLIRTREVGSARLLGVYHDHIRERIRSSLSGAESAALHERLFATIELSGQTDPDWLHTLALGAGRTREALHYGKVAAERASTGLAFERAVGLHRKCIELAPAEEAGELWGKLALALARCGRGVEAAEASLEAGRLTPEKAVGWMQRAASHLLRSGHFAQGEELVRKVLESKGVGLPTSDAGISAAIAWERARIKLHGKRDRLRSSEECPPELLERCDLLTALFVDVHPYDSRRATLFQVRALRCALEAGEPTRLRHALTTASMAAALYGSAQAGAEADALLERAAAINAKLPVPDSQTMNVTRAVNAYALGRLQEVLASTDEAGQLLRSDAQQAPNGNYHRRFGVASIRVAVMQAFGQYERSSSELRGMLQEAAANDNRALSLLLTRSQTIAEQVEGKASHSRKRLDAQRELLPAERFGLLHVLHIASVTSTACWTKEYAWANESLASMWPAFLDSAVRRAAYLGLMAHSEHARFVLNQQATGQPRGAAPTEDLRALSSSPLPAAGAFVERFRARIALAEGRRDEAEARLGTSSAAFEALGMLHEAARDRFALGAVVGGEQGALLQLAAEQRMRELGVAVPRADVNAHYPELSGG